MKKLAVYTLTAGMLLLSGCGASMFALMIHPDGRVVQCKGDSSLTDINNIQATQKCVESYRALGFKEVEVDKSK